MCLLESVQKIQFKTKKPSYKHAILSIILGHKILQYRF